MNKDLISSLDQGPILCAEGYLFAMERRGYLSAGAFVPEVVLEHPEVLIQLHDKKTINLLQIQRIKKRKLILKDRIMYLRNKIEPDIIA